MEFILAIAQIFRLNRLDAMVQGLRHHHSIEKLIKCIFAKMVLSSVLFQRSFETKEREKKNKNKMMPAKEKEWQQEHNKCEAENESKLNGFG